MPFKAIDRYGNEITADKCSINDKGKDFYCLTKGCKAILRLVHADDPENAFFRRIPSSAPHMNVDCVRCSMIFNEHKHDESMFFPDEMFSYVLATPRESKHSGSSGTKNIRTAPRSAAKTIRTMYEILCKYGINGYYNGFKLGDIFATYENYEFYKENLSGKHIVEVSFYYKPYKENYLIFNYPYDYKSEHMYVRVNFPDKYKAIEYYKRFKEKSHTDILLICGEWRKCDEIFVSKQKDRAANTWKEIEKIISFECDYISGRQIYDPS